MSTVEWTTFIKGDDSKVNAHAKLIFTYLDGIAETASQRDGADRYLAQYIDIHLTKLTAPEPGSAKPNAETGPVLRMWPNGIADRGTIVEATPAPKPQEITWEAFLKPGHLKDTVGTMFSTAQLINAYDPATTDNGQRTVHAIDIHTEINGQLRLGPTYRVYRDSSAIKTTQRRDLIDLPTLKPTTDLQKLVAGKRRHLDSPYGQDLHELAEIDILAGDLRQLVTLAEIGLKHISEELPPDPETPADRTPGYAARDTAARMMRDMAKGLDVAAINNGNFTGGYDKPNGVAVAYQHLADHALAVADILRELALGLDQ